MLVRSYTISLGLESVITRSSNNYGPYQYPEKFIPLFTTHALEDKPLPLYGDGKYVRDWLYVEDNCRGIWAALEKGKSGEAYNAWWLEGQKTRDIGGTLGTREIADAVIERLETVRA